MRIIAYLLAIGAIGILWLLLVYLTIRLGAAAYFRSKKSCKSGVRSKGGNGEV